MRYTIAMSAVVLGLSMATAFAGEGNGDPFPGPDAAVTSSTTGAKLTMGNQAPFQFNNPAAAMNMRGYHQALGTPQNPFPFSATGMTMSTTPASPSAVAGRQGPGTTSFGASAPAGFHG